LAFATLTPQATFAAPAITLKASFDGSSGYPSYNELTPDGNGKFFGTSSYLGVDENDAIYEFDPSGSGSITLKAILDPLKDPSTLTPDGTGKFFGTTYTGGLNNNGAVFEFDPSGSGSITLKASFDQFIEGGGRLSPDGNGKFFGTSYAGGVNGSGSIYEFDPSGSGSITLKASFDAGVSTGPSALTPAGDGTFYVTTSPQGAGLSLGSIYQFDPSLGSIILKASFPVGVVSALTPAGDGTFYGFIRNYGAYGFGSIYQFDPSLGSITLKASFEGIGARPGGTALTPASDGTFYGTTYFGGANNIGSIYQFDPGSGSITLKASFTGYPNGGDYPFVTMTPAGDGTFYGATTFGGAYDSGSIYQFDPNASSSVPGPLPLMGAGAAFGWSRRLRRRIQAVRPVFPMGR
jgi:uncharacterized repeat protein (TIGR03803 family)